MKDSQGQEEMNEYMVRARVQGDEQEVEVVLTRNEKLPEIKNK